MDSFVKKCPLCDKLFTSLIEFCSHVVKKHPQVSVEKLIDMGNEHEIPQTEIESD